MRIIIHLDRLEKSRRSELIGTIKKEYIDYDLNIDFTTQKMKDIIKKRTGNEFINKDKISFAEFEKNVIEKGLQIADLIDKSLLNILEK